MFGLIEVGSATALQTTLKSWKGSWMLRAMQHEAVQRQSCKGYFPIAAQPCKNMKSIPKFTDCTDYSEVRWELWRGTCKKCSLCWGECSSALTISGLSAAASTRKSSWLSIVLSPEVASWKVGRPWPGRLHLRPRIFRDCFQSLSCGRSGFFCRSSSMALQSSICTQYHWKSI